MVYKIPRWADPHARNSENPNGFMMDCNDSFKLIFQIVLFGTFIETGVGLIHGFNERILSVNPKLSDKNRALIGILLLMASIFIANAIGLIGLIAKGYGALTWGYWIIFVIPVLTIGVHKVLKNE